MRYNKTESLTDVLNQFMRKEGLESPLQEYRLISSWNEIIGEVMARYTQDIAIKNQVLHVTISSPVVRNEIIMRRQELVRKLNEKAGALIIVDIFVR